MTGVLEARGSRVSDFREEAVDMGCRAMLFVLEFFGTSPASPPKDAAPGSLPLQFSASSSAESRFTQLRRALKYGVLRHQQENLFRHVNILPD